MSYAGTIETANEQIVVLDIGNVYAISKLNLRFVHSYPRDFTALVSVNGTDFINIATITDLGKAEYEGNYWASKQIEFNETAARYIKIIVTKHISEDTNWHGIGFSEFEVYGRKFVSPYDVTLKTIEVDGQTVALPSSGTVISHTIVSGAKNLSVTATSNSTTNKVTIDNDGKVEYSGGEKNVNITVSSSDGKFSVTYTLKLIDSSYGNKAIGGTIGAYREIGGEYAELTTAWNNPKTNAIDGDASSTVQFNVASVASESDPYEIRLDLGEIYELSKININYVHSYARDFKIFVSADGENYSIELTSKIDCGKAEFDSDYWHKENLEFAEQAIRYIKIIVTKDITDDVRHSIGFTEIEVFGRINISL